MEREWNRGEKEFNFVHVKVELPVSGEPQQAVRNVDLKLKGEIQA